MAPDKKPLGVLILHGFTGSLDTVRPVAPIAEKLGLPWRMPVMRGHGTRFEDLVGVEPADWVADAEAALTSLLAEVERVVIVGLSMGGVVTLELATRHPDKLAGLVLLAPALRFADPLTHLTPLLKVFFQFWDSPSAFNDKSLAHLSTNYLRFPTATFGKLMAFGQAMERRLGVVTVPTVTLFSKKDQIIHKSVPGLMQAGLGSQDKRVVWFETSGHEMLQDCESQTVAAAIEAELVRFRDAAMATPATAS